MAKETMDPHQQQCILSDVAADEAALDIHIEMAIQRYQALYYSVQMKDLATTAKQEKNKLLEELIEAKKSELDKVMKMREDIQKQIASLQQSTANSQKLLAFLKEHRITILQQRESIRVRYQVLIDKKKEKINSYPLVLEFNKLKNELLAADVELRVLKYQNAEMKRQNKLMIEIQEKRQNNAIVELARIYLNAKKLEEENFRLSQELEEAKSSLIRSEGQEETNLDEISAVDWTNKFTSDEPTKVHNQANGSLSLSDQPMQLVQNVQRNEIDGVLKNFREKFQVKMRTSSVQLPSILSVERRYASLKPGQSAQVISAGTNNEKSDETAKAADKEEIPKTDEKYDQKNSGKIIPQPDGSTTKSSDVSNDSMHDSNMRLRNASIASKFGSNTSTNSSEKKRLLPNAAQRGLKYMKTDDFVGAKRLSDRYQHAASNPIDQGKSGQFFEQIVHHSGKRSAGKPPHQNIQSAVRASKEKESTLSPEGTGPPLTAQEDDGVPSTCFDERPIGRNEKIVPISVQRYAYDEYNKNGLNNRPSDGADCNVNMHLERDEEKQYTSPGIVAGERRSAEADFLAGEQEFMLEDEFEFRSDNRDGYENYSGHNDEIDVNDDCIGAPIIRRDDGLKTHPSRGSSEKNSSYEGIFSGPSNNELPGFDEDLFVSSRERSSPHPFENMFRDSDNNGNRENFF